MKTEQSYDFRKKLLEVHEKNIRDFSLLPHGNEFEFSSIIIRNTAFHVY